MNNKVIIPIIVGIVVLSLGISLHRISSKSADLQYEFLSKTMAEPSGMESTGDKASGNYGKAEAFDAESSDAILFIERKITSLEPCRISAGSIILDIPLGAVSSEKDVTVRGLRDNELPELDYGLVNVTSTYGGYRCLPHGKFNKPLQLSIGYDTLLIPAGYSPHDIRTFFYDEDRMEWVCMPVDSIDQEHQLVVTSTDHFTDFINGILTQPEIPDASGYANTSIRGIEYANPLEGMNIMQAPTANNNGSCSMNYPIVLPAGRNGMAPQISISYSSDVKDGIMGPGWSLNIPSITVDTRWGVPPYSTTDESESYLVNGEAIVESEEDPNTGTITRHKPLYVESGGERGSEKTYAYLKEGKFDKIVRHGDSPQNYWWEVTDRNGVKYIYGDEEQDDQLQHSLAGNAPDNNIAVWGLAKMKDPYGNAVEYFYDIETEDEALEELHPLAKQMRVSEIKYTSLENEGQYEEGKYHVAFEYEEEPAIEPPLSANYGFFTSDMRMLSKISVTYNGSFVKCYKFKYEEAGSLDYGVLPKKRLVAIAEITDPDMESEFDNWEGSQKQGLYVHTFDYYLEEGITFERGESLDVSEGDSPNVLGQLIPGEKNISKNTSYALTVGGSACVGVNDGVPTIKSNTLGANYHYSYDINNQKSQIIDLNGDGVVDRVEKNGDIIKFYKGYISEGNNVSFEIGAHTLSITKLGKSASQTHTVGSELFLSFIGIHGQIGGSYSNTKTINSDYFLDVNGDGFVDFVSENTVYLNFPNNGIPRFINWGSNQERTSLYDECYKFGYDGDVDMDLGVKKSRTRRDPVVLWKNPFPMDCDVKVDYMIGGNSNYYSSAVQGYSIYDENNNLVTRQYKPAPSSLRAGYGDNEVSAFHVPQGGYILFHLHGEIEDCVDIFDSFHIILEPEYPLLDETMQPSPYFSMIGEDYINVTDANGKRLFYYDYDNDAVVQNCAVLRDDDNLYVNEQLLVKENSFYATCTGQVSYSVSLHATEIKSDDLKFCVVVNRHNNGEYTPEEIECRVFKSRLEQMLTVEILNEPIYLNEKDQLLFELRSDSNVDWSDISFTSSVRYVGENVQDRETYHPSLNMSIYSNQLCMSRPIFLEEGSYIVQPNSRLLRYFRNCNIELTVKSHNKLIEKGIVSNSNNGGFYFVNPVSQLVYFDYTIHGKNESNHDFYPDCKVTVTNNDNRNREDYYAGLFAYYDVPKMYMSGNLYRGWGQFSYLDTLVVARPDDVEQGITLSSICDVYSYNPIPLRDLKLDQILTENEINSTSGEFSRIIRNSDNPDDNFAEDLENYVNNPEGLLAKARDPKFAPMLADVVNGKWVDPFNSAFVQPGIIGSGSGMQYIKQEFENMQANNEGIAEYGDRLPNFDSPLGSRRLPIVNKVSENESFSFSAAAGFGDIENLNVGYNHTNTWTKGLSDMMDMNGDGYPDIVGARQIQYTSPNGDMSNNIFRFDDEHDDVYTSYSKGKSNGGSISFKPNVIKEKTTSPKSTEMNIPSFGLSESHSENNGISSYIDVNSDGLPDIVSSDNDDERYYVEYNLGYKFSKAYSLDINNSVYISSNKSSSSINNSLPFPLSFNKGNYSFSGGIGLNGNNSGDQATMMDVNSDGLMDIVCCGTYNSLKVYYNNGRGFEANPQFIYGLYDLSNNQTLNISTNVSGSLGFLLEKFKIVASAYADLLFSISNEKYRVMDINGDGAFDILEINDEGVSVKYGKPQKRNLLKKVTTPALGEYEMAYSMLYPDVDNPSHKWIMAALKVSDNDGDFADGSDELHYEFKYAGMKYHRIERESYGFAEVHTIIVNPDNSDMLRQQRDYYITENGLRHGLKYRDEVLDSHDILQTSTDYNWTLNDLNTGDVVEEFVCGSEQEVYPRLKSELTTVYSSNSSNTLVSEKRYEYGKYGNITKYTNNYNPYESVMAEMTYSPNRSVNLLDMMTDMTVKSADDQILRKIRREYTSEGKISQVDNFITENTWERTTYGYDRYGNLMSVCYPNSVIYIYTYGDDDTHTYLSQIDEYFISNNGMDLQLSTRLNNYDYRFGKPTEIVAPNGTRTEYTYYSDGKIRSIKSPMDEEYSVKFEYWDELRNQTPRWARVIHNDGFIRGNTFVTHTICDGLGRTMLNARKAVVDGEVRYVVSGKNVYDAYGRVISSYQPAEVSREDDCLSARFENPTKYTYDCMDRVLTTRTPDEKEIFKSYDVSDEMGNPTMMVTTTYPLDRKQITYTDSRGLQIATMQYSESDYITTKFEYSPMGELISSKDPEGAVTKYSYDMLGHLVQRDHPDAGTTVYTYVRGNLVSMATQKLQNAGRAINYVYEGNRLKKILYPDDNQDMNVYYEYGGSNDGLNAGLVTKRQDGVSLQTYSYNEMGDLIENVRNFATPDRQLMTFKTMWTYDTWGRIKDITYPDRETVKYKYDNAGKVVSMISNNENSRDEIIVGDIRYDKYGNRTSVKYGNGTHNHYEYDPLSLQLTHMSSFAADVVLQDVHYEYDDVYNIIGINNDGEFHYRYDYMYDRLNRLVKSDGQSALDAGYHFEMTYSPAGKIMDYILTGQNNIGGEISGFDRHDEYLYANQQQPHTVTHIGPDKYLWDANGNIKRRIGNRARRPEVREHYFNEENRLAAISDGLVDEEGRPMEDPSLRGAAAAYLYDADGERVWKFSGIVTDAYRNERRVSRDLELDKTFYPTQHITLDNRNLYKHYFIGDERISTEVCRWDERQFTQPESRIILLDGNEREFAEKVIKQVKRALAHVGYEDPFEFNRGDYSHPEQEKFFYHYTHQGSVAALTDHHGEFYQHLQYLPYGDVFVDKHRGSFASPYTFSAKEKDSESGYSYFGARYYTDNIMMWLSVDPMSDERPWISPYNYCQWNPIGRVDTWGALDDWYKTANGEIEYNENIHSAEEMKAQGIQGTYLGKTYKEGSTYYSLFGHQMDLSTWKGRFYEAMDEALKSHAEYVTAPIDPNDPEPRQEPTVDFGVAKYKNSFMENNKYQVEYEDGKGYYQVFGNDKAMKGSLEFGKLKYNANKNYGFAITEPGYNVYVKNKNGAAIVQLVFPDLESRVNFYNKWANEFQIKK